LLLPADLPIVDHHCHLSPTGEGVGAATRFAAGGGTHLFLNTQAYGTEPPTSVQEYEEQFGQTSRLAHRIREETGVGVYVVLAPYPVDLVSLGPQLGIRAAVDIQLAALDLAGRWIAAQQAVALGEVGRPHFPVSAELAEACEEVFRHALEVGRDVGCPVVVHSEDLDEAGFRNLASLAAQCSFPPGRLIKHYTRRFIRLEGRAGIVPSFLANRKLVADSLRSEGPWFWETDFLDDPQRPGAVMDILTIPRRVRQIAAHTPELVDRLHIPFQKSIREVYGFAPEVASREHP
jgi:TatD-related deoxyribonuclease